MRGAYKDKEIETILLNNPNIRNLEKQLQDGEEVLIDITHLGNSEVEVSLEVTHGGELFKSNFRFVNGDRVNNYVSMNSACERFMDYVLGYSEE